MSQLEKLAKLKDAGVLSEGEFGTAKQRVLGKPAGDTTVIRLPNTETSAGDNTPCVPPVGRNTKHALQRAVRGGRGVRGLEFF